MDSQLLVRICIGVSLIGIVIWQVFAPRSYKKDHKTENSVDPRKVQYKKAVEEANQQVLKIVGVWIEEGVIPEAHRIDDVIISISKKYGVKIEDMDPPMKVSEILDSYLVGQV